MICSRPSDIQDWAVDMVKPSVVALVLLALALPAGPASAQASRPAFPPHTIGNSQLRVLPPTSAGRHYQLHIGLPASYAKETTRRYPVVYVTDAYWDFQKIDAIRGGLVYDKVVPEFIVVGLGYAGENLDYGTLRSWELSPAPFGAGASGHAAEFLRTIEAEIIPFVEREYRADPSYRVLAGASLGGLFTLYSMYTRPDLFQAYIAATPAVVVGNNWLFGYEDEFAKAGRPLKARLFVSGGGNESPGFLGGILRFNQRIASRKTPGLAYEFRIIDGERHAGMQFESYVRGLRFAFVPLAPESGPSPDSRE
jgi:predicted alpha/beta superfamily hydrolase